MEPWNQGDSQPDAEENPGSRCRQKLGGQERLRTPSKYIHVKQEQHVPEPPDNSKIEPKLPHPLFTKKLDIFEA